MSMFEAKINSQVVFRCKCINQAAFVRTLLHLFGSAAYLAHVEKLS